MVDAYISLTVLVARVKDAQIKRVIKELCQNMVVKKKGQEQLRDVSIMGMAVRSLLFFFLPLTQFCFLHVPPRKKCFLAKDRFGRFTTSYNCSCITHFYVIYSQ